MRMQACTHPLATLLGWQQTRRYLSTHLKCPAPMSHFSSSRASLLVRSSRSFATYLAGSQYPAVMQGGECALDSRL